MENIFQKIKRFNETINSEIEYKLNPFEKLYIFFDFVIERVFHKTMLLDYTQYKFYDKKNRERRKYVVFGRLIEIMEICNDNSYRHIFDDKIEFNKKFQNYIYRTWIDLREIKFDEFNNFIDSNDEFFIKDPLGMFGTGIKKIQSNEIQDRKKLYNELKERNALCEEPISQCNEMAKFNKSTVNTIRVVTMVDRNNTPYVIGGLLRLGRTGKFADNYHHNGIAAYINPELGIVSTMGVDKNKKKHVLHPDTSEKIVGFEVPNWEELVKVIKKAALEVPQMRYIGWDVAITSDYKVELIEGNSGADPDAEQITTQEGRWNYYKKYF
ncbi:sugar-transfer associated ATP-grasp domain-containing protein [Lagierella sp.]|uniref:sugar-transfer associated ATP-grasp domain-containing protein n=1 Tax=Lagierella sp. TaxID=2849657 RepID=UPI002606EBED|nr:sugar-transfer associated ATP-grasp domain-containing protein [Lagierella sp.]